MHYKNGREAKNGDKVVMFTYGGNMVVGVLYDATPGNDSCNGKLAVTAPNDPMPNLRECLHLDDVKGLFKEGKDEYGNTLDLAAVPDTSKKG